MQQRAFLAECDIILKYLYSFKENQGPSISEFKEFEISNNFQNNIHSLRGHMHKRGHVKNYSGYSSILLDAGREFARQTTYVEEYDKEYKTKEIENVVQEDKPAAILRSKRKYIIAILMLIATIVGLIIGQALCR